MATRYTWRVAELFAMLMIHRLCSERRCTSSQDSHQQVRPLHYCISPSSHLHSLYSNRDVFLRELISNANDAIEKLRLTALTDKEVWDGASPLNITIKAVKDESGGRLIISGMDHRHGQR